MRDLDDRLRQLVQEMADATPVVDYPPTLDVSRDPDESRPATRFAVALAVVFILTVGGIFWRLSVTDDTAVETVAAGEAEPPPQQSPTLPEPPARDSFAGLGPDQWLYPSVLPEGIEFDLALASQGLRSAFFGNDNGRSLGINVTSREFGDLTIGGPAEEVVINGRSWTYRPKRGFGYDTGEAWIQVSASSFAYDDLVEVIASLEIVEASSLPRPPIDLDNGTFFDVARAVEGGREITLSITTDGVYYGHRRIFSSHLASAGCCSSLEETEFIRLSGGTSPGPTRDGEPPSGDGVLEGVVHESVAVVEIRLTDGSTIATEPQDLHDSFPVNFIFVTIPVTGDELLGNVEVVVALDEDGNELGRATELSG